jgi:hypothetical protein
VRHGASGKRAVCGAAAMPGSTGKYRGAFPVTLARGAKGPAARSPADRWRMLSSCRQSGEIQGGDDGGGQEDESEKRHFSLLSSDGEIAWIELTLST